MISGGDPMGDRTMDRRPFVGLAAAGGAAAVESRIPARARHGGRPAAAPFELEEATIAELQAGMKSGKYTARGLTAAYVQRIDALDRKGPALRAVLEVNPDALAQAERSEEHTSELQSLAYLVCRLLLEKKKKKHNNS